MGRGKHRVLYQWFMPMPCGADVNGICLLHQSSVRAKHILKNDWVGYIDCIAYTFQQQ